MRYTQISFVALLCLILTNAHAQNSLQGKISDKEQHAVNEATVILYNLPDTTISETTYADSTGHFSIKMNLQQGLLQIIAPGYKSIYKSVDNTNSVIPEIQLEQNTTHHVLKDITVSARKPLIERKVDRTVFNVESSVSSIGSDAFELLKRAPNVRVTNSDIGIVGKGSVSVMINDKLVQLSGEELENQLRTIRSENIAKIEVITTPPARYDAEGNAGIINIVTRHAVKTGLNGNIGITYTQRMRAGNAVTGSFNYRNNDLNIYGNADMIDNVFSSFQNNTTYYSAERQEQKLVQVNNSRFYSGLAGIDYNINKNSVIGASFHYGARDRRINQDYHINVLANSSEALDSLMRTTALQTVGGNNNEANVNYEWRIDSSGKKLNIDLNYFHDDNITDRNFTTDNYFASGISTGHATDNKTNGEQIVNVRSAKADFTWPAEWADLSFGGKISGIHNNSNNLFRYLSSGNYITDPAKTDTFEYWENTQALYFSGQKNMGEHWETQLGLRGEYTQTKGASASLKQTNTNSYFRLFPTAYLQYKKNEDHIFNLNYSRRIERPEYWGLNPFRQYTTATSYTSGNPFLQPIAINNFELSYTLKSSYTFSLYASNERNFITYVSVIDSINNSYHFTSANAGNTWDYGMTANAELELFDWWECNIEADGYYSWLKSGYYGDKRAILIPAANIQVVNTITLNPAKTLIAELWAHAESSQQDELDKLYGYFVCGGGFKAQLMKKQLTLNFTFNDPFHQGYHRVRNLYNNTYQNHYYDQQSFSLSVNWKFGNKNIKRREHDTGNDETRRAGGN